MGPYLAHLNIANVEPVIENNAETSQEATKVVTESTPQRSQNASSQKGLTQADEIPKELSRRTIANRENGAKSKGPTTEEGKSRISQNAMKHGLYAKKNVVIPLDDQEEFEPFHESMIEHFQPTDPLQRNLVDRIIMCSWRLRRINTLEALLLSPSSEGYSRFPQTNYRGLEDSNHLINLTKYEATVERSLYQALDTLTRLQSQAPKKLISEETNPI
jgi:hypothetical protein